jgi:hypothetical protein
LEKATRQFLNFCIKSLAEAMDVRSMNHLARSLIHGYDLYDRTRIPRSMAIPNIDAAKQILLDMQKENLLLNFVQTMISWQEEGRMGKRYQFNYLSDILKELASIGFLYDRSNQTFIENSNIRKTKNWGSLTPGELYSLAFLGIDIIGNSRLVKKYPKELIESCYADFQEIIVESINKREGRVWLWEGDGGIITFYKSNKQQAAVLSAIDILNEIFLYNKLYSELDEEIEVRLCIHCGELEYSDDAEDFKKSMVIKQLLKIETDYGTDKSIIISAPVRMMLDGFLASQFLAIEDGQGDQKYIYSMGWES